MTGFGEGLRVERERRGLTLETLCAATKVQQRHLEALERENFSALPGGVFRRGIVRAYLAATGLAENEWMPRFERSLHEQGGEAPTGEEAWATFAENVKRNRAPIAGSSIWMRWLGVAALLLFVLAAAWAVWHYLLHDRLHL
jgi:cytoskeletal protein RodZ